jgi:hypothetical protein
VPQLRMTDALRNVGGMLARDIRRSSHAGHVIMVLLIIVILGIGIYESVVAVVDPSASIVIPFMNSLLHHGSAIPVDPTDIPLE